MGKIDVHGKSEKQIREGQKKKKKKTHKGEAQCELCVQYYV